MRDIFGIQRRVGGEWCVVVHCLFMRASTGGRGDDEQPGRFAGVGASVGGAGGEEEGLAVASVKSRVATGGEGLDSLRADRCDGRVSRWIDSQFETQEWQLSILVLGQSDIGVLSGLDGRTLRPLDLLIQSRTLQNQNGSRQGYQTDLPNSFENQKDRRYYFRRRRR